MIDPFSLGVLIYLGVIAVVFIAITFDELYSWFRNRSAIKENNKDIVGFTLAQRINSKAYVEVPGVFGGSENTQMVQGFYDKRTNKVLEGRLMKSDEPTDYGIVRTHDEGDGLVLYN